MMRAKMLVQEVTVPFNGAEQLKLAAVCGNAPFGTNGESEDNTFARYTPSASLEMIITNPSLVGKIKAGQKFYVDFTPVE